MGASCVVLRNSLLLRRRNNAVPNDFPGGARNTQRSTGVSRCDDDDAGEQGRMEIDLRNVYEYRDVRVDRSIKMRRFLNNITF